MKIIQTIICSMALILVLACVGNAGISLYGDGDGYDSTSKDWLSNTTDDIDGNGLGTDGYIFFGDFRVNPPNNNTDPGDDQNENIFGANQLAASLITVSQPSYISTAATGADSSSIGRYAYEMIDSPILGDGTDRNAGNLLIGVTAGEALEFTVSGLAANTTIRVGVLGAVLNDDGRARFDAPTIGLTDGTTTANVTGLPNLSDGTAGASLGWVFFDIDSDGDYTILVPPDTAGPSPDVTGLGGVTFDSNQTPTASNATVTATEDIAKGITLTGSDPEGSSLNYAIVDSPTNGTLTGTVPNLTYLADTTNFFGVDSFTFEVDDGIFTSSVATVSITVDSVNDVPEADDLSLAAMDNTATNITLSGSDVESNLTYTVVSWPTHGTLTTNVSLPNMIYTATAGYSGPDSFTYTVNDGIVDSAAATVTIEVQAILAGWDFDSGDGDADIESANLSAGVFDGTWANTAHNATSLGGVQTGTDSLGNAGFGTAQFGGIMVSGNNRRSDTPASDEYFSVSLAADAGYGLELRYLTFYSTYGDNGGDAYTVRSSVDNYTADLASANPMPDDWGTNVVVLGSTLDGVTNVEFRIYVFDKDNNITTASLTAFDNVSIVGSLNQLPVANDDTVSTDEDTSENITLSGSDPEGSDVTYHITQPANGTLVTNGSLPNVTYTPNANYNGPDSFTFRVHDGTHYSTNATVSITVSSVEDLPFAYDDSVTTPEDTATNITLVATDGDAVDTLTYVLLTQPANGTVTTNGALPNVTYTPNANYNGSDSFTFEVHDGDDTTVVHTVSINITSVNDLPEATDKTFGVAKNDSVAVTLIGSDLENASPTFTVVLGPSNGDLSGSAPNLTYTPDADYTGNDIFTFTVSDGEATTAEATVTIRVLEALAGYDFDDGTGSSTRVANLAHSRVTASDFDTGSGLENVFTTSANALGGAADAEGNLFGTANSISFGGTQEQFLFANNDALNENEYMTFTVTPDAGYELNLTSFTFRTRVGQENNGAQYWALCSSVDGFGSTGVAIQQGETTDLATWTGDSNNIVVDLSEEKFQGLYTATEFRLYIWGGGANSSASATVFDKVLLNGATEFRGPFGAPVQINFEDLSVGDGGANTLNIGGSTDGISVARTAPGNDYLYTVTYTKDLNSDGLDDTLTFGVLVEGKSGTTFTYATEGNAEATIGTVNPAATVSGVRWVVGATYMSGGETLKFSIVNASSSLDGTVVFEGFGGMKVSEYSWANHRPIIGEGTGLDAFEFHGASALRTISPALSPLYISAGNDASANNRWGVELLDFSIRFVPPQATVFRFL